MAISFHFQNIQKQAFFKFNRIKSWLKGIALKEKVLINDLNYIFGDDEDLLKINSGYLGHDTYTDIITFDHSEQKHKIEGDVFISLERVEANAKKFNTTFENETYRVMAHGLLHLCGYKDKKKKDIVLMRKKEEECLELL